MAGRMKRSGWVWISKTPLGRQKGMVSRNRGKEATLTSACLAWASEDIPGDEFGQHRTITATQALAAGVTVTADNSVWARKGAEPRPETEQAEPEYRATLSNS